MPYKIPKGLFPIKTIKTNNGVLEGKSDDQGNMYWFKDGKYITPSVMKTYRYYDPELKGYRRLGDRATMKVAEGMIDFKGVRNPVYTPALDHLLSEQEKKDIVRNQSENNQKIPLNNQDWITLRTKGRMNLTDIPMNLLDSIAVNAGRSGTDFWTDAAVIGKESTFGGYSKYLGNPYNPTDSSLYPHYLTNNHAYFETPESDYREASFKKYDHSNEAELLKAEEDAKYAIEHGLVREQTPHYSQYFLADAFKRYQTAPTQYNPGQKNYVPMVNDIRQELQGEKQLQQYWNTKGKQEYARGQQEGMAYGGHLQPKDAWDRLSMREKAEMMKVAVRNGITKLQDIKQKYNEFAEGGDTEEGFPPIVPFTQKGEVIITPDTEYNQYLNTLPDNQRFTSNDKYDSYLYWKLNSRPRNFEEAYNRDMFHYDHSDNSYHANSIAWGNDGIGYFMKPKDHDTVGYETDWYNNGIVTEEGGWRRPVDYPEWLELQDFRNNYNLIDDPTRPNFYRYEPKALGGNTFKGGGYKPSDSVRKRISAWEGAAMTGAVDPLSGKWGKNRSFGEEADSFYNVLPASIREQVLSNPELADNLFSYSYNVGAGNFRKRVVPALKRYYTGNGSPEDIANSMWATGDKKLRGLRKRRAVERKGVVDALTPAFVQEPADNTFVFNPFAIQANNTQMIPMMVPDEERYVTTHEASPSEQRAESIKNRFDAINRFNVLMDLINPQNNPIPEFMPTTGNSFLDALGLFANSNARGGWKHGLGGNLFLTGGPEENGRGEVTNLSIWDELAAQSPLFYTIGKAIDPTGISGYGDARKAINQYDSSPSLSNGYTAVMETLGALPIVSKAGKAIKFLQGAVTGQGVFDDYNYAQEKKKEYGDELVVDYWDNTVKPRREAERHGEQMKSKMAYTDVHHVPSFKLAPKGSKLGQVLSDYDINHRVVKKYKKAISQ